MRLYSKTLGSGPSVIILHGLFGMSDNWLTIGKALSLKGFTVHLLDLRNHGRSPHADSHRYPDMCEDLLDYFEENDLDTVSIIGHSMGGKLAMIFALLHPEKIEKLVVVDIAPADYRHPDNSFHINLIENLLQIDLSAHKERGQIKAELEKLLHDRPLAMFLAKNIKKDEVTKQFMWKFNLPVLKKYLSHLHIGLEELEIHAPCLAQTLFIKGSDSNYYLPEHDPERLFFFPDSKVVSIDNAGHWVHSDETALFLQFAHDFLSSNASFDQTSRQ